jgi:hypothetical protein
MSRPAPEPADARYCDHCGGPVADSDHRECRKRRALDPPRYCETCGRRLVVQVVPRGWTATCSRHGVV